MVDHYRNLAQSLVSLGFLFRRQGEGRQEIWRNRQTDQEIAFNREEVAKSRAAAAAVLADAQADSSASKPSKPAGKATVKAKSAKRTASGKAPAAKAKRSSVAGTASGKKRATARRRTR